MAIPLTFEALLLAVFCVVLKAEYVLKPLPFEVNALEPFISETTILTHYNKHHGGYVKKLNAAKETKDNPPLTQIIESADQYSAKVVNLASQIYNHQFYWECIAPMNTAHGKTQGGDLPNGMSQELYQALNRDFGSLEQFWTEFAIKAKGHFGSGWLWLVHDDQGLSVQEGHDAENPLALSKVPMLTIDVWEHAYYLDYKNERARYVDEFMNRINWEFVSTQFALFEAIRKSEL